MSHPIFRPTAPVVGGTRAPERISGTGSTSAASATALNVGTLAALHVGAEAVSVRFGSSAPTAVVNDVKLGAYSIYEWMVETDSRYVALVAADGSAAFEAHVYQRSV